MPNKQNNEIIQEYYAGQDDIRPHGNNNIVLIITLVFFAGTIGYFLGVNNFFTKFTNLFVPNSTQSTKLQDLSDEELDKLIDGSKYDFSLYTQIVGNLKQLYVDPEAVKDEKLFDGTIKGMVDGIGDDNTYYMTKAEYAKYKESLSGTFQGIGVRLTYNTNGKIEVGGILPNSPAQSSGVQVGLVIDKVDNKSVNGKTIEEVTSLIRGKEGTKVKIDFYDQKENKNKTFEIQRASIKVESIRLVEKSSDTVILEVNRFTESTPEIWMKLWDEKINQINSKGYSKVILDLRGNGGGYLSAAVYAAGDFMPNGKLIVTEKSRSNTDKQLKTTDAKERLKNKKVVVLVDNDTASASEILTAALRYHNNVKVIGKKTYGKGTVQSIYELSNGGALKVTIEYWLMPDGKKLDKENPISPDIDSSMDLDKVKVGVDTMLEDALKQLE